MITCYKNPCAVHALGNVKQHERSPDTESELSIGGALGLDCVVHRPCKGSIQGVVATRSRVELCIVKMQGNFQARSV